MSQVWLHYTVVFCEVTPSVIVMFARDFGVGSLMIASAARSSGVAMV